MYSFGTAHAVNAFDLTQGTTTMQFHAVAEIFPLMSDEEFAGLRADIATNGLLEPIWIYDNKIIDGRNRYRACLAENIEPQFRPWSGKGDLVAFVISLNLKRRHLNDAQRALVAAKMANMRQGQRTEKTAGAERLSQSVAAQAFGVSVDSVGRASKVIKQGVSELAERIESGEMKSLSEAARIAGLPKTKQKRIIRRGREAAKTLLTRSKIRSLESSLKPGSGCLHCDPGALFSDQTVSAHLQHLAAKSQTFARYFNAIVEEIEESELSSDTQDAQASILCAIDQGYQEEVQIQKRTSIGRELLKHTIAVMLDYGVVESFHQGGKTDVARGARKLLYRRPEKPVTREPEIDYYDEMARMDEIVSI